MIVCDGGGGGRVALVIWVVDVCAISNQQILIL